MREGDQEAMRDNPDSAPVDPAGSAEVKPAEKLENDGRCSEEIEWINRIAAIAKAILMSKLRKLG